MWRFLICFVVSLHASHAFAVPATPVPLETRWFNMECARIFEHPQSQKLFNDEAESMAREFLQKAGITATPVICSGAPDPFQVAASQMRPYGFDRYLFIMLDTQFRRAIRSHIRSVIAHEVGHLIARGGTTCNREVDAHDIDAYVLCEHEVDMAADQLTGGDVPPMLKVVIRYLDTRLSDIHPERANEQVRLLRRRVTLIERATRTKAVR